MQSNQHAIDVRVVEKRPPAFLRLRDAANDLACSVGHIRNLIGIGKVPSVKIDGLVRIRAKDWNCYTATAEPITPSTRIAAVKSA